MSIYVELNKALKDVEISIHDIESLEKLTMRVSSNRVTQAMLHKSFKECVRR